MVLVMERPPLALEVGIETPDGMFARWGADDQARPENQPQGLSLSTAMPGGFDTAGCTLARDPRRAYPDAKPLSKFQARGLGGGTVAWEGRLEQLSDTGGNTSALTPQAVGYQAALDDDNSAAMIFIDQMYGGWGDPPLPQQIALLANPYVLGSPSTGADPTGNPRLVMEIDDSVAGQQMQAQAWYDAGVAGLIQKIYYAMTRGHGISNASPWFEAASIIAYDGTTVTTEVTSGNLIGGTSSGVITASTPSRYGVVVHAYTGSPAGAGGQYQSYWQVAVVGNHGLPVKGAWPGSLGLLASDIIGYAVATWAPEIGVSAESVQPSVFVIPQLAYMSPTTASQMIKDAAQYELLDWAVWEGPTLWCNPFGTSAKTRNWRARVGECQLQEAGQDVSRLFNGVLVTFTAADGTTQTVGPPGSTAQTTDPTLQDTDPENQANQAGIRRWATLSMGTSTPAGAITTGQQYLLAQKQLDLSGQASLVGHVQDDRGVWWPAWMVRAGDTLTIADAADTTPRRIVSTSYDAPSVTNTVQLNQPPDQIGALLQRLSVALAPLQLS